MAQEFPFDHFLKMGNSHSHNELSNNRVLVSNAHPSPSIVNAGPAEFQNEELQVINYEILNHLKTVVPELKYKTYFENNLELKNISDGSIHFEVRTSFIKKSVDLYKEEIAKALFNILGTHYDITISSKDQKDQSDYKFGGPPPAQTHKSFTDVKFTLDLTPTRNDLASKVQAQYIEHMNPKQTGISIDDSKTFDNFIVGATNNMAQAVSKAVAQNPGKDGKYPSLYIHSNSGLGKTHLLHSIANEINERFPELTVCLITARDFMEEMINLMKNNKINEFVKKYTEKIDVLMIDDIHELKNKEGTQDQFFHVFNEMHSKGKQLIFTSDKRPKEIDGISERIKTRLQWGLVVDIQPPDLETRIAILRRKMEALDLYITEDILTFIATRIKTNIRELEGSLVRLKAVSELMNVEIEIDLVKEQLMLPSGESDDEVTIEQVAKATAQYFRIPLVDLKSKARNKDMTRARHIAMYLARSMVSAKQQEIGEYFGGRNHSSIIHAVNTITRKIKKDASLAKDIDTIEGLI